MNSIKERIKELVKAKDIGPADLARMTNTKRDRWANVLYHPTKPNGDDIEALVGVWPEYAYWLTTGKVIIEAGQISPDLEKTRKDSERAGTATK